MKNCIWSFVDSLGVALYNSLCVRIISLDRTTKAPPAGGVPPARGTLRFVSNFADSPKLAQVIVTNGVLSAEDQEYYEAYIAEKYPQLNIRRLILTLEEDRVHFSIEPEKRILTKMGGTLISDPLTWNDAKRRVF